ncbi:Site-specific DNA recombinase [Nitrosospira multiformis ATCC 25196]|uniref:Recombinase n=1 Tax=Nitrosospira multiformis (strain ATCC 25196 / NCIMB 11849 / C 71) TaxID=323848 RepID=Q2YCV5_NITMU|nr:recombinase family protein [Nitrosospira multiformis]ABB73416.1 Recombinase [Nitrosospira multiformis ATCC 25196]SEG21123.1 Site-specific DNA recombinase [Nitrosospira multiformis ATCC 25196]
MRKAYSYIRMSTDKQLSGDSLRRQREASEKYAKAHGLELIETLDGKDLRDIGVSGFKGANSRRGVLSVFLEHLNDGKIDANSILLIESFDRLSRADVLDAFSLFTNILNKGIEIITLSDNQRYTRDSVRVNPGQLFLTIGIMTRANEESVTKSKRGLSVWNNKRDNAQKKPITSRCPAWLTYSSESEKFEVIEERARVVRLIFELCAKTSGTWSISRYLNRHNIPVFGDAQFWQKSYVNKILSNRAVLGEFQPNSRESGQRIPVGKVIENYYPAIISATEFHLAWAARDRRNKTGSGRKGINFSNLFSGLVYCGNCGSKMSVRNRGVPPKGGKWLVCQNHLAGAGCEMREWKLPLVEDAIFKHLYEVDFSELLGNKSAGFDIEKELFALQVEQKELESKMDQAIEMSAAQELNEQSRFRYVKLINQLESDINEKKKCISSKEKELEVFKSQQSLLHTKELKETLLLLEKNKDDYYFRSSVNQLLTRTIARIDLITDHGGPLPWEIEPDDKIVGNFRALYPKLSSLSIDELVLQRVFLDYITLIC